jgi:queuine tRNA-ribosyltransferase
VLDARDSYGTRSVFKNKALQQERKLRLGNYEVVVREEIGRIRHTSSGEVMHSVNEPAVEARLLYVEQSRLTDRLKTTSAEPLVVWDVGLGAAANAMATIHAVESMEPAERRRKLLLVSFENDLDSLRLALRHNRWFKHLRHAAPARLISEYRWEHASGSIEWLLLNGDFAHRKFDAPLPDIVFFDPFSFKTDGALWTLSSFRELAAICQDRSTEMFTYTCSTAVRAAMLAAGFHVAKGRATGPKNETTVALTCVAAAGEHPYEMLDKDWLAKWERSDAQAPLGADEGDESWRAAIVGHRQF